MKYISTRNGSKEFNFTEVFIKGLADDGGLFIPKTIPAISEQDLLRLSKLNYKDLAKEIIFLFCGETIRKDELSNIGLRLNQQPPNIVIEKSSTGGIAIAQQVKLKKM